MINPYPQPAGGSVVIVLSNIVFGTFGGNQTGGFTIGGMASTTSPYPQTTNTALAGAVSVVTQPIQITG